MTDRTLAELAVARNRHARDSRLPAFRRHHDHRRRLRHNTGEETMIRYHGRLMPCFMGGCEKGATHRVESSHALLHMCEAHAREMTNQSGWTMVALAPIGDTDVLDARSMDPTLLAQSPHVVSQDDASAEPAPQEET